MKIGIIVHSQTGNTLSVAEQLKDTLLKVGHQVKIERVTAVKEESTESKIELKDRPEIKDFDVLILGAPVRAFSASPVMMKYLSQLESLKGIKVGCFVTQYFPFSWMGGKRAISHMSNRIKSKDASVYQTSIVNWSSSKRSKQITELIKQFSDI